MSLLKIARMGHPVLRRAAEPVTDPTDPELRRLAQDMVETMLDAPGVGLAAPQVYVPLRIIAARLDADRAAADAVPLAVFLNPEIEPLDDVDDVDAVVDGWEGCLSLPGLRGVVPRLRRIGFRAMDLDGRTVEREFSGYTARILQHEVDHLDGCLYIQRIADLRRLAFNEEAHHLATASSTRA